MKWILASGSPRRQQLLCQITEDFSVLPSQIEERRDPSWTAQELPRQLAAQKALDVSSRNPAALVIGPDVPIRSIPVWLSAGMERCCPLLSSVPRWIFIR